VQADLLRGKSIGFLPTKVHVPEAKEIDKYGWKDVGLVIDEWLLLEYACTFLPAQQNALVEAVGKSSVALPDEFIQAMGLSADLFQQSAPGLGTAPALGAGLLTPPTPLSAGLPSPLIPFTPLAEIERAIERHLAAWDLRRLTHQAVQEHLDRIRGRI
jgi:hypothetical protein